MEPFEKIEGRDGQSEGRGEGGRSFSGESKFFVVMIETERKRVRERGRKIEGHPYLREKRLPVR